MKVNAERVRELREQNSWTQEELAEKAGINLRTVQRIESKGSASLRSTRALAEVFETDVQDLSDGGFRMDTMMDAPPRFGFAAVAFGFLALAAVLGHFFVGPIDPPPPLEISIAEKAASIRDATVAALKGEEYDNGSSAKVRTMDDWLTYAFMAMAGIAILSSIIGFIQHERIRPAIAGAFLGGLAITFQVATVLFFAFLFAMVLTAVIDQLDFDFFD